MLGGRRSSGEGRSSTAEWAGDRTPGSSTAIELLPQDRPAGVSLSTHHQQFDPDMLRTPSGERRQ